LESLRVNGEIRRIAKRHPKPEDTLVEALLVATRLAHENPLTRSLMEDIGPSSRNADPANLVQEVQRERWRSLLSRVEHEEKIASGLTFEEISSWLTLAQGMLLVKVDSVSFTDTELRAFIRRFIVTPILKAPPSAWRLR
jgi:hypothetical protein